MTEHASTAADEPICCEPFASLAVDARRLFGIESARTG
jgi:hypothetical protein